MKVFLSGGAGFIGSHVAEHLIDQGHEVTIFDNLSTGLRENVHPQAQFIFGDIRSGDIQKVFTDQQFDAVIHLAAQTGVPASIESPDYDCDVNIKGTVNLLEACRRTHVQRFIFASTAAVYGNVQQVPVTEEAITSPTAFYGLSKLTVEKYLNLYRSQFGIDYVVLRYANVYGERQGEGGEGGVVSIFVRKIFRGEEVMIFGDGGQTRDFIYVGDVAAANCQALVTEQPNQVYNISTQSETSVTAMLHLLEGISNKQAKLSYGEMRQGDIYRSALSNERARMNLPWLPEIPLAMGLARTYRYLTHKEDLV
jgi:UDP-glucose 4-epimerase